ncbi:ABC transporter substrate-binding protein [Halarcobacter sp.]|uniref:ABC transporter substrate-binding protein n=1 Tax=Halarcobacter sp. TaxID=2321133 RepID=UPI0029F57869|nr:ABC transporter substrate-binding protein [Halarcobacter sp.]
MKKFLFVLGLISNLIAGERIVALSPSLNEIVFALGSGKDIVANTLHSDYPEESKNILKVGGYSTISLEKILLSKPTLVFTQDYDEKLLKNLESLNLNYYSFKTDNLESIQNTILKIGNILNKQSRAEAIIEEINTNLDSLKNIIKDKKIMVVISPRLDLNRSVYISGNNLYFNDIIKYSGNKNAYQSKSKSQPVVNIEKIINMNPDIVVLLAPFMHSQSLTKEQLKSSWKKLPINASKSDNIYVIDKDYAGIPSNRVNYFIQDFKKILENVKHK